MPREKKKKGKQPQGPPEQPPREQAQSPIPDPVKEKKIIVFHNADSLGKLSDEGENNQFIKLLMNSAEIMLKAAEVGRRRAVLFTLTEEDYKRPYMPFALSSYKPQKEWLVGAVKKLCNLLEENLQLTVRIELLRLVAGPGYRYCLVVYWPKSTSP